MTVYLLHLDKPLMRGTLPNGKPLQAGHYIGFTQELLARIFEHSDGKGSRFTRVCVLRGVNFALARTWDGAGRTFMLCPICHPETALNRARLEFV